MKKIKFGFDLDVAFHDCKINDILNVLKREWQHTIPTLELPKNLILKTFPDEGSLILSDQTLLSQFFEYDQDAVYYLKVCDVNRFIDGLVPNKTK